MVPYTKNVYYVIYYSHAVFLELIIVIKDVIDSPVS